MIIIFNSNEVHDEIIDNYASKSNGIVLRRKEDLTLDRLSKYDPTHIFFIHWSFLIPAEIYERFNCILFHMTDLPFGRGGSPLQNLIVRGLEETMISAIKVSKGLDTGPVFMKRGLSLHGSAEEIFLRAGKIMCGMITEILNSNIIPIQQTGEAVIFMRRTPSQGDISKLNTLEELYDYVRMLDSVGYPKAFIETKSFKMEFSRAALRKGHVVCDVKISLK